MEAEDTGPRKKNPHPASPLADRFFLDYFEIMLEITPQHDALQGSLTARSEGQLVGHIDFVPVSPGVIDLNHTKVFPEFEGRGFGRELVRAAVDFARTEGLKLRASCPYARKVLDHNPDYRDVLA